MKVRFSILAALAAMIAGLHGGTALATGSTHIWAPSTDVQAFKVWHITCDLYVPIRPASSGSLLPTVTNVGLTVGVLPFKKLNAEVGFDHKSGLGYADNYPLYGNFKLGVPENVFGHISPSLAVGVFDVGTKIGWTDFNVMYGKLAKTIAINKVSLGRVSAGYFIGSKKLLIDDNGAEDNHGPMVAWERTMTEFSDKLWICLEYMGTKSAYGSFNLGASWKFAPNVALLGGYEIYNNSAFVDTATLQVDIDM